MVALDALLEQGAGRAGDAHVLVIGRVFECLVERDPTHALLLVGAQKLIEHESIESARVQHEDVRDGAAVDHSRSRFRPVEEFDTAVHVGPAQGLDGLGGRGGAAAHEGAIIRPVAEVDGDFGEPIVVLLQVRAHCVQRGAVATLAQERVSEHPSRASGTGIVADELGEQPIVAIDAAREAFGADLANVVVSPGMVAEWMPGIAPKLEHLTPVGMALDRGTVDEAIDGRNSVRSERVEDLSVHVHDGLLRQQRPMRWQVVKGDGHANRRLRCSRWRVGFARRESGASARTRLAGRQRNA
jgi:hypothetical protein